MQILIFLALLNGVLIGMSRAINGRLVEKVGPIRTAVWNHAVGFAFLSIVIATLFRSDLAVESSAPVRAWLGGVLGVAAPCWTNPGSMVDDSVPG